MAFNKNRPRKRPYTLRARARRKEEVRRRITEATVHLHGSVGPARTTVSEIAALAGVQRATVYNHFPTDLELIDACSSHWFTANPPPDPASWAEITDPNRRAVTALSAMYAYYDRSQEMLEKVLRDAALVPALEEILQRKWWPLMEGIVGILVQLSEASEALRATSRVALDFFTWRSLIASGLSNDEAARLAAAWMKTIRNPATEGEE
jgi:AcrR family transcriptional regulator